MADAGILSHLAGLPLLCEVEEGGDEAGGAVAFVSPTSVTLDRSVEEPDEPVRGPVRSVIGCAVDLGGWVDVVAGFLVKSPNESRRLPSSPKEASSLVRSDSRLLPSVVEVWRKREREIGDVFSMENGILGSTHYKQYRENNQIVCKSWPAE